MTWSDLSIAGQNESGFRLEIAAGASGPWNLAVDAATDATAAAAGSIAPATQRPRHSLVDIAAANYLALTFRRRMGASVVAEATGDLAGGPWLDDPVQLGAPTDNGDGTGTVTFRDRVPMDGSPRRFMRVRVTTP
jgi:hypothetical protein